MSEQSSSPIRYETDGSPRLPHLRLARLGVYLEVAQHKTPIDTAALLYVAGRLDSRPDLPTSLPVSVSVASRLPQTLTTLIVGGLPQLFPVVTRQSVHPLFTASPSSLIVCHLLHQSPLGRPNRLVLHRSRLASHHLLGRRDELLEASPAWLCGGKVSRFDSISLLNDRPTHLTVLFCALCPSAGATLILISINTALIQACPPKLAGFAGAFSNASFQIGAMFGIVITTGINNAVSRDLTVWKATSAGFW